jgi:hypothetical protein
MRALHAVIALGGIRRNQPERDVAGDRLRERSEAGP